MNEPGTSASLIVRKAYRLKLYPKREHAAAMARHAGACRWLWNHLLALQKDRYAAEGKFVFFHEMSKMLPGLKKEFPWLALAPSNALVRVCRNLDRALRDSFKGGTKQFPHFKKKGKAKESFYVSNQLMALGDRRVDLPKVGQVRFRTGRLPQGRIVGATVAFHGGSWWCTVQCEQEMEVPTVAISAATVVGVDLGLKDLLVCSDGVSVRAPKPLRKAEKKLKRVQKRLSRAQKGSNNRRKQARRVAVQHRKVTDKRRDAQHKATAALVARASAVVTESPNVAGMLKNRHLAKSLSDAGFGELLRQVAYKCAWAGKAHVRAGMFEPSTQTCSACRTRKTGSDKLQLHQRTFRCTNCGLVIDRDLNAALNLRRLGLKALGLDDVGQVMPERAREIRLRADACGDPSAGQAAQAACRYGSRKQEVAAGTTSCAT